MISAARVEYADTQQSKAQGEWPSLADFTLRS